MKTRTGKKKSIFLRIALLAFSVYVLVMLIQLQSELQQKKSQDAKLTAEIQNQEKINEDIKHKSEDFKSSCEQQARDEGMAVPGEIVFKETPGS